MKKSILYLNRFSVFQCQVLRGQKMEVVTKDEHNFWREFAWVMELGRNDEWQAMFRLQFVLLQVQDCGGFTFKVGVNGW